MGVPVNVPKADKKKSMVKKPLGVKYVGGADVGGPLRKNFKKIVSKVKGV